MTGSTSTSTSANPTSVAMANEVNLFVFDREFVARLDELFALDLSRSRAVRKEELDDRSVGQKAQDYAALQALETLDFIAGPRPPRDSET